MAEQSLEETAPGLKSEDPNVAEAADVLDAEELTKSDDGESCAVEAEEEEEEEEEGATRQAGAEEDEDNMQNTPQKPEEEFEASGMDDLHDLPVGDVFEEEDAADLEMFPNENEEEEPESQVEMDHRQCTDDLQLNLRMDSEGEQELLQELQTEHEKLTQLNYQLQAKLSEYFKSNSDLKSVQEILPNQDCCQKYPDIIEDVKRQTQDKKQKHRHVDDLRRQYNEKLEQIEREWSMLASAMREVVITDLEQAMSKMESQAVAERLLTAAQKCEEEFVSVRNEHFKLNLKLAMLKAGFHGREEDIDGDMHRIDYEQLKFENETYNEKIQENIKDLIELKKTFPQTGQILMHVKEKLSFVQVENQEKQAHFDKLDALVLHEQKALAQTMQVRDTLRFDNLHKRKDCGLLENPVLLRDLEDTEDEREALEKQVEMLKRS